MYSLLLRTCVLFFLASLTPLASSAYAKAFPSRPIHMIVPFPAGGGLDAIARIVASRMSNDLGQPVIVENRAGGGTIIGTELLAHAAPDGYTIMYTNVAFGANPALHHKLPYNTLKDFAPVSLASLGPAILVVNPKVPVKSVKQLVALAKSEPGKLSFASAGRGGYTYLVMERFMNVAGINILNVPYRGAAHALTAVLANRIPIMFVTPQLGLPDIKAGKLRPLGVTSAKRMAQLPNVPTIAASGYPGFAVYNWQGVVVPAHTPAPIIEKLNKTINKVVRLRAVKERMARLGVVAAGSTPAQLAERIRSDIAKWTKLVKEAHIHVSN